MYFHAGNNKLIRTGEIIGIFDLDNCTMTDTSRRFLSGAERRGEVINIRGEEIPRAFLLTGDETSSKVYISQLSSLSLVNRIRDIRL